MTENKHQHQLEQLKRMEEIGRQLERKRVIEIIKQAVIDGAYMDKVEILLKITTQVLEGKNI